MINSKDSKIAYDSPAVITSDELKTSEENSEEIPHSTHQEIAHSTHQEIPHSTHLEIAHTPNHEIVNTANEETFKTSYEEKAHTANDKSAHTVDEERGHTSIQTIAETHQGKLYNFCLNKSDIGSTRNTSARRQEGDRFESQSDNESCPKTLKMVSTAALSGARLK